MAAKSHIKLNRDVKIDGVDFEAGIYPADEIDSGRHISIMNAGWGEYCDAPKSKAKVQTDDDDDLDETGSAVPTKPTAPKPAGKRSRKSQ
jgi:hypothetical protein